jgi:hypothetical protein
MLPSALQDAREWLTRADEDLQVADLAVRAAPPHLGTAAYHAQQAAEKALKGFLTAHGVPFRPTHDLVASYGGTVSNSTPGSASTCRRLKSSRRMPPGSAIPVGRSTPARSKQSKRSGSLATYSALSVSGSTFEGLLVVVT